jgi:hypothetical protein
LIIRVTEEINVKLKEADKVTLAILVLIVIIVLITGCGKAEAQTTKPFEAYTYFELQPQIAVEKGGKKTGDHFTTIQILHQRKRWLGLFVETAHGNNWGETAIGPSFQVTHELNVSVAAAVSHYENEGLRGRFNAYYDSEKTGSFVYAEAGVGKYDSWVAIDAVRMLGKNVGLGAILQMPGGGAGPKLDLRVNDHFRFWAAPVYEWKEKNFRVLVGARLMFED